jgi:hypothetical protein
MNTSTSTISPRFLTIVGFVLAGAALRLVPHPPNFTPIGAMALFGGVYFAGTASAYGIPLAAMLLSSTLMGYGVDAGTAFIYAGFVATTLLGRLVRTRRTPLTIAGAAFGGSLVFFILSNLGLWMFGAIYPTTPTGLLACYEAAIPFFGATLAGDALYTLLLFGGFALAERFIPILREQPSAAGA